MKYRTIIKDKESLSEHEIDELRDDYDLCVDQDNAYAIAVLTKDEFEILFGKKKGRRIGEQDMPQICGICMDVLPDTSVEKMSHNEAANTWHGEFNKLSGVVIYRTALCEKHANMVEAFINILRGN